MSDAHEVDDSLIESGMFYGHQVIRRAKYDKLQAENRQLNQHAKEQRQYLRRVLDLDLDVACDEDRQLLDEIAALEDGDECVE